MSSNNNDDFNYILNVIKNEIKENELKEDELTLNFIKTILKKYQINNNKDINIFNKLTNMSIPILEKEDEDKVIQLFIDIDKICDMK